LIIVLRLESGTLTTALFIHNNLFFDAKFICYFLPTGIFVMFFVFIFYFAKFVSNLHCLFWFLMYFESSLQTVGGFD
jgi:hypothetical protein